MTDPTSDLRKASAAYKRARDRSEKIMLEPREELTKLVRDAYAAGMRKSEILRAIDHVWSRQWVDDTVRDIDPPGGRPKRATSRTAG